MYFARVLSPLCGLLLYGAATIAPAATAALPAAAAAPTVTVKGGVLRGAELGGTQVFLGIPYAAPPLGALRWRAPQAAAAWSGARDATQYGAACTQGEDRFFGLTPKVRSEDCLYLNVWAPPHAAAPLPVMVWLHGGAHRIGTAAIASYDGGALARRGVVVVTLNYRLGYLGYFAHPALAAEGKAGNFGLLDQIAALRWVQDNIAAFGGDPQRVTVFGESAGGADILYLLTSEAGYGLFQQAIVESGGGWGKPLPREKMQKKVVAALETIGVAQDANAAALRALPAEKLITAQAGDRNLGFGPFIDGDSVFEAPARVIAEGRQMKVPLIIGSNDWEGSLLKFRKPGFMDQVLTRLPAVSGWYEGQADNAEARQPLLFRDIVFAAPARWVATQHSAQAPAWLYRFAHVSASRRGQVPGAGHAAEIAYVFDTLDSLKVFGSTVDDDDRKLAATLADCWVAFAKTGAPRCAPAWAAHGAQADTLLLIDGTAHEVKTPDAAALDGVTKYFGPGGWLD
ncbi:MAG: carboxylesterase/lipase family protein [Solimonas sp.]